jgi:hypothetical protein
MLRCFAKRSLETRTAVVPALSGGSFEAVPTASGRHLRMRGAYMAVLLSRGR